MRTHYDNLKVAETAPDEVVRAAYRALSQRYHPDRNPGNADAHRIMQIVNDAYATLSDPVRRRQYDDFLSRARQTPQNGTRVAPPPPSQPAERTLTPRRSVWRSLLAILFWDVRFTLAVVVIAGLSIASLFEQKRPRKPYTRNPPLASSSSAPVSYAPARPAYVRPATAPNGRAWPASATYIPGYPLTATGGLSSVTVDNTRNSSDVFLKLVSLDSLEAFPVRVCFIPAYAQFTFKAVAPGRYDVRYRDLETGGYSKTEEFVVTQTKTYEGTEFSNLSLTLYKVAHGNMHTEAIDESEF